MIGMLWKRGKREKREAEAIAFLEKTSTPAPSSRLVHYGLQRVLAKVEAGGDIARKRRSAYRIPSLAYRVTLVLLLIPLLLVFFTAGAYAISYNAQPDSSLYGTKIFFERVRLGLTLSSGSDFQLEMMYSDRRLDELDKILASGNRKGVDRWLREYLRNVGEASSLVDQAPTPEGEALSRQFLQTLERQAAHMEGIRQEVSSELETPIEQAYQACNRERERMRGRCGMDGGGMESPVSPDETPGKEGNDGEKGGNHGDNQGPYQSVEGDLNQDMSTGSDQGNSQPTQEGPGQSCDQGSRYPTHKRFDAEGNGQEGPP